MLRFILALLVTLFFSGCSKKEEISCSNETVQSIVHDITQNQVADTIALENLTKDPKKAPMILLVGVMCQNSANFGECFENIDTLSQLGGAKNDENLSKKLREALQYDEAVQLAKKAKFSMSDFLTKSKNKELHKVECQAIATYDTGKKRYSYFVEYDAQLTDDGKKVYVKIKKFEAKGNNNAQ
jgi:hypothetical protein